MNKKTQPFRFKQFAIVQDSCGMKVSTDGVILGSWAGKEISQSLTSERMPELQIIDIGTGTGLLSLMIAQQLHDILNLNFNIYAIEIDEEASLQATKNCNNSPFSKHITVKNENVLDWQIQQLKSSHATSKADFIVCNPPYFSNEQKSQNQQRVTARHDDNLTFAQLLNTSERLLKKDASLFVVLPETEVNRFLSCANSTNWQRVKKLNIRATPNAEVNRCCLKLQLKSEDPVQSSSLEFNQVEEVTIRNDEEQYHESFVVLCRDYYLKM